LDAINSYATECGFERIKIWGDYQLNDFNKKLLRVALIYLRKNNDYRTFTDFKRYYRSISGKAFR
jgi:hypothetical protein